MRFFAVFATLQVFSRIGDSDPCIYAVTMTLFDVFLWRSLFAAALIAVLAIGAGLSWLVAQIRAREQSPQTRSMPRTAASGAKATIAG